VRGGGVFRCGVENREDSGCWVVGRGEERREEPRPWGGSGGAQDSETGSVGER